MLINWCLFALWVITSILYIIEHKRRIRRDGECLNLECRIIRLENLLENKREAFKRNRNNIECSKGDSYD